MKSYTIKATIACIAALSLLGACSLFSSGSASADGPASLKITVASPATKTVYAVSSGAIGLYKASLSQGGTQVAEKSSDGTTIGFSDIEPGVYTLAVQGLASDGATLIASASVDLTLVSGNNVKSVALAYATSGSGSLSYSVTWPSGIAVAKVDYAYGLVGADSLTNNEIAVADDTIAASISGLSLACGDYRFRFSFLDASGNSLLAYTEIVQILPGLVSTGSRTLTSASFASAPSAPADFAAAQAYPGAALSWSYGASQLNTATGYAIQRSVDGSSDWTDLAAITDGATLAYTDTSVAAGVTYDYRIYATNAFGSSASPATVPFAEPALSLTYSAGKASSGSVPGSATYRPGDSATVAGNTGTLARTYYTFAGWNTAKDGTGTSYAAGASLTFKDDSVTLYSAWTAVAPSVTSTSFYFEEDGSASGSLTCDQSDSIAWTIYSCPSRGTLYRGDGTTSVTTAKTAISSATDWSFKRHKDDDGYNIVDGVIHSSAADNAYSAAVTAYTYGGKLYCLYDKIVVVAKNEDTGASSAPTEVDFYMHPVDDAPVMNMSTDPIGVVTGDFTVVTPAAKDVDTIQSGLSYRIVDFPSSGNLYQYFGDANAEKTPITSENPTITDLQGRFYYEAGINEGSESLPVTFTIEAYDGEKYSDPMTLTFSILPANDDPSQ
jgi:hypothetical protein